MEYEILADYDCVCGENPLWHPDEQRFYWTDIPTGRLFVYDARTGEHQQIHKGRSVGGFTIERDGSLLLFMDRGTVAVFENGRITDTLIEEIPDEVNTRFNDLIADPEGRVFCGTMPVKNQRPGRLYRLDTDRSLRILLEDIGCSNGLGFTPDLKGLYYIDSPKKTIYRFDYDRATGAITGQRDFVTTHDLPGVPDGMTVDREGCVWCARWEGGCIIRYDPQGKEMSRITLPAQRITSCIFGGEHMDELYITSAIAGSEKTGDNAHAGAIFRIRPGVKGNPEFRSRIRG